MDERAISYLGPVGQTKTIDTDGDTFTLAGGYEHWLISVTGDDVYLAPGVDGGAVETDSEACDIEVVNGAVLVPLSVRSGGVIRTTLGVKAANGSAVVRIYPYEARRV